MPEIRGLSLAHGQTTRDHVFGEHLARILRYLQPANLWRAAAVSRGFCACSWTSGLYIHRHIVWGDPAVSRRQLLVFDAVVKHALSKKRKIFLSVSFWRPQYAMQVDVDLMNRIASSITAARSHLIYLLLEVDKMEDVDAILAAPMPCLQEFKLMPAEHSLSCPLSLPQARPLLFDGTAPLLRKVTLVGVALGTKVSGAFSKVTSLSFVYHDDLPLLAFSRHFPELLHMTLWSEADDDLERSQHFRLSGLTKLRSLTFGTGIKLSYIRTIVARDTVSLIRRKHDHMEWIEPKEDTADFSLRLAFRAVEYAPLTAVVVPAHRRWRRIYELTDWHPARSFPLAGKPHGGAARLTYLRVDAAVLHAFLSCGAAACPALSHIQIDISSRTRNGTLLWPPDTTDPTFAAARFLPQHKSAETFASASLYDVACPALAELMLFALDGQETVDSRAVAFLGRALGQLERPQHQKAVLALAGVALAEPEAHALLDQTFSNVERFLFSGSYSPEDYDEGLWEGLSKSDSPRGV